MAQHDRIRVTVVGGLDRAAERWTQAGAEIGVELEHHPGRTAGRGSRDLVAAVRRADVVVIITDPNSHGGVGVARRAAISAARPHLLVKHLRPSGLGAVLREQPWFLSIWDGAVRKTVEPGSTPGRNR